MFSDQSTKMRRQVANFTKIFDNRHHRAHFPNVVSRFLLNAID